MKIFLALLVCVALSVRLKAGVVVSDLARLLPQGDTLSVLIDGTQPAVLELMPGLVAAVSSPGKDSKGAQTHLSVFKVAGGTYTLVGSTGFEFENSLLANLFRFSPDKSGDIVIGVSEHLGASIGVCSLHILRYNSKNSQLTPVQEIKDSRGCSLTYFTDATKDEPARIFCDFKHGPKRKECYRWSGKEFIESTDLDVYSDYTFIHGAWGKGDTEFGYFKQQDGGMYPDMLPNAIFVDASENVYVLDPVNERISVYSGIGKLTKLVPLAALKDYEIYNPWWNSLAIDRAGIIYVLTKYLAGRFPNTAIIKLDDTGKVLGQYLSTAELRTNYKTVPQKLATNLQKFKDMPGATVLPDSVGRMFKLIPDNSGRVEVLADDGVLLDLTGDKITTRTSQGWPSIDRKAVYLREPSMPVRATLPKKPDPIEKLQLKDANGITLFSIEAKDIVKLLPTGVAIQDIGYITDDAAGDKFFTVLAENKVNGRYILKYKKGANAPSSIFPIKNGETTPYTISQAGNIYQLSSEVDDSPGGVSVIKWSIAGRE